MEFTLSKTLTSDPSDAFGDDFTPHDWPPWLFAFTTSVAVVVVACPCALGWGVSLCSWLWRVPVLLVVACINHLFPTTYIAVLSSDALGLATPTAVMVVSGGQVVLLSVQDESTPQNKLIKDVFIPYDKDLYITTIFGNPSPKNYQYWLFYPLLLHGYFWPSREPEWVHATVFWLRVENRWRTSKRWGGWDFLTSIYVHLGNKNQIQALHRIFAECDGYTKRVFFYHNQLSCDICLFSTYLTRSMLYCLIKLALWPKASRQSRLV